MPRKLENKAFLENQLRIFIKSRHPAPTTRLRAMAMLAALSGFPISPEKDTEPEVAPEPIPVMADNVTKMLEQAAKDRKRGGANANKLSEGSH